MRREQSGCRKKRLGTYEAGDGVASAKAARAEAEETVGGWRRGSWRRCLEMPDSLLKETPDLLSFWLLEKLLFWDRENMTNKTITGKGISRRRKWGMIAEVRLSVR